MTSSRSDIVDIHADLKHETEKAYLISDGSREAWIPKSQCERNDDGTFSMPEWIAMDKGLI